ncbi:sulfatase [Algisphaera agarilytica]|uniref:Arylsulfatase A-like enzyme n=1 Tax=Algisphaera agarilytica TaxID=1385975 RepID=A0A7X0H9E4_9BACT|nr:sulfatase [Algisphaera agarilytica]MBB6431693.1 arylsulfatase A-like enzyme [Algisphaera agarilytica]
MPKRVPLTVTAAFQLVTAFALAFASLTVNTARAQSVQPNIIFIMADDMGWADLSTGLTNYGDPSDFYETPALETLATQGMAFTNAYATPTCAATRAAILSGAYATRSTNNVYQVGSLNPASQTNSMLVGPSQGTNGSNDKLSTATITHAETLQAAGYTTATVGKFHVAPNANQIISDHGFDENFGGQQAGAPGSYHANNGVFGPAIHSSLDPFASNYTQDYVDNNIKPYANGTDVAAIDALVGTAKHVTDASTDAAIDFMTRNADDPFYLQYSAFAVHTPIDTAQARADLLDKYNNLSPGTEDSNASYGALVEGLDQGVARLIDHLQTTADPRNPGQTLDQNTLVIFYSDNGGLEPQTNLSVLSGQKGELDEGGIRVPMIAWSGNSDLVDGGTVSDAVVMPTDFYTTFASLGSATLPTSQAFDGEDLSGVFADSSVTPDRDNVYWHMPGYSQSGRQRPQSVTRSGDWKLLYNYEDQSYELYNLATDLGETNNLAEDEAFAHILADLGGDLLQWLDDTDAPLATLRSGLLEIMIDGQAYANGVITEYDQEIVTIAAGEEVPFVLNTNVIPEPASAACLSLLAGLGLSRPTRRRTSDH